MGKTIIYELSQNFDHIKANDDYDVWQVVQKPQETIKKLFWYPQPITKIPDCKFKGKIQESLSWVDYPRTRFGFPIMSKKMVNVLTSIGQFRHQIIPLEISDWKSEIKTDDFVFLHLMECIDVLDKEKSEYDELGLVISVALKTSISKYPPFFLIEGDDHLYRYVSQEAKDALEAAEIKGLHFVPVK